MESPLLVCLPHFRPTALMCVFTLALYGCSSSDTPLQTDINATSENEQPSTVSTADTEPTPQTEPGMELSGALTQPASVTNEPVFDDSNISDELVTDESSTDNEQVTEEISNTDESSTDNEQVADESSTGDELVIDESNALMIWREVVAVINEEQVNEFFAKATEEINFQRRFNVSNTIDDIAFSESFRADPPYQYEQNFGSAELVEIVDGETYTCAAGGNIHHYINQTFSTGSDSVFNGCAVNNAISSGVTYSGVTGGRNIFRGSIASTYFRDFTRVSSNGETTVLTGSMDAGNTSSVSVDRLDGWLDLNFHQINSEQDFRLSNFNIVRTTIDGETNVGITSGSPGGVFVTFNRYRLENTIDGSFTVFAPWVGTSTGLSVEFHLEYSDDVNIDLDNPDLEFPGRDPIQPFNWEAGSVTISAGDSFMVITPSETDIGSFELELSNGTTIGPLPWVNEFYINH